jgi:GNAT superfamily N-acetyltransferase
MRQCGLDNEHTIVVEVSSRVLETPDLCVFGQEIEDRVVHEMSPLDRIEPWIKWQQLTSTAVGTPREANEPTFMLTVSLPSDDFERTHEHLPRLVAFAKYVGHEPGGVERLSYVGLSLMSRDPAEPVAHYRVAGRSDLEAVIALLNDDELGAKRNPQFDEAPGQYARAFDRILDDPNNDFVVADLDGRVVGCYQLTFIVGLSHMGGERAQIESVRIASDLRGTGLGTQLMLDAISRARSGGCFLVQLTTDARRDHTERFYERLGFVASHHGMKLTISPGTPIEIAP